MLLPCFERIEGGDVKQKSTPQPKGRQAGTNRPARGSSAATSSSAPEFVVTRESFNRYFEKPLATSTFHDLVNKGKIIPMKGMRGFYLLNESLRRLGLREVLDLPRPPSGPSREDIVRLAFTQIDRSLFPDPVWLLSVEAIDFRDADHARLLADQHRDEVNAFDHVALKLAYFQGVLDAVAFDGVED